MDLIFRNLFHAEIDMFLATTLTIPSNRLYNWKAHYYFPHITGETQWIMFYILIWQIYDLRPINTSENHMITWFVSHIQIIKLVVKLGLIVLRNKNSNNIYLCFALVRTRLLFILTKWCFNFFLRLDVWFMAWVPLSAFDWHVSIRKWGQRLLDVWLVA